MVLTRLQNFFTGTDKSRLFVFVFAAILILLSSASGISRLVTDFWWFQSVDYASIWSSILLTQVVLGLVFVVLAIAIVAVNLYIAQRIAPTSLAGDLSDYLTKRFTEILERSKLLVIGGVAGLVGLVSGSQAASEWQSWILFTNGSSWGVEDPILNRDIGFYVFDLPFITFVNDWLFWLLMVTTLLTVGVYFLGGAFNPAIRKMTLVDSSKLKLHISLLAVALVLVRAVGYFLDRFELLYSDFGGFRGILSTDNQIRLPGLVLMILIAVVAAVFLILNIRRKGWGFAAIALGLWGLSHIAVLGILPNIYQRLRVDPVRSTREAAFVEHNIAFTRLAYGLDEIDERVVDFQPGLTASNADATEAVFESVPVVDPDRAVDEFTINQTVRGSFEFDDTLDIDRYEIDGELRPVVIAARELDLGAVPDNWEDRSIVNTHGYGVVAAAAHEQPDNVEGVGLEESQPLDFQLEGLGLEETVVDDRFPENFNERPQVYFSPNLNGYAVIGAERDEVDFQSADNTSVEFRYDGEGGVGIDGLFSRLAFSLRFAELDPLISGSLTGESRVLLNRDIVDRARAIAPFLAYDSDPYPVVDDGRIVWILDAYTVSNDFPYSTQAQTTLGGAADLSGGYNYVRNSVKVVVDSFEGSVDFYNFDEEDPLLQAWSSAFGDLLKPSSELSEGLRAHVRYPRDIFTVQTDMWADYVIDDPQVFIQGDTSWSIANEPSNSPVGSEDADVLGAAGPMAAQYTFNRVPSVDGVVEPENEFVIQRLFAPRNSNDDRARNLTGVMMARSDGDAYGDLVLVRLPSGQVQTPDIVDTEIRKLASLTVYNREREGNTIDFGEMHLVFAEDNVVFVRSVYAEIPGSGNVPELVRVVASTGDTQRAMGSTLEEAIELLVGIGEGEVVELDVDENGNVIEPAETPDELATPDIDDDDDPVVVPDTDDDDDADDAPVTQPGSVTDFLRQAEDLLEEADEAEADGDADLAAELRAEANDAISSSLDLLGG